MKCNLFQKQLEFHDRVAQHANMCYLIFTGPAEDETAVNKDRYNCTPAPIKKKNNKWLFWECKFEYENCKLLSQIKYNENYVNYIEKYFKSIV